MMVRGAFNKLLEPSLARTFAGKIWFADRTGVSDVQLGAAPRERKQHIDWPPPDWPPKPEKWWEEI